MEIFDLLAVIYGILNYECNGRNVLHRQWLIVCPITKIVDFIVVFCRYRF